VSSFRLHKIFFRHDKSAALLGAPALSPNCGMTLEQIIQSKVDLKETRSPTDAKLRVCRQQSFVTFQHSLHLLVCAGVVVNF
jgi:hypothetical protein